jgi:fructose-1,6-bisphosphatase/inositol monophosphatase family enzyme
VTNGRLCAGVVYPLLAEGDIDFVLFWRTLPWDHAPGVLLAEEAGVTVGRLDRTPYYPTQTSVGLLAAADTFVWGQALTLLD